MNYFLLKFVYSRPEGWLWYAPQYHLAMFVGLVVVILMLLIVVYLLAKILVRLNLLIAQQITTTCPSCNKETLVTVQECSSPQCRSIRVLKNSEALGRKKASESRVPELVLQ